MWLGLACASALFAGVTAILAKIGVKNTDSTLATAIRTAVVLAFSWLLVFITGAQAGIAGGGREELAVPGAVGAGHRAAPGFAISRPCNWGTSTR